MTSSFVLSLRWDVFFLRQFMGMSTACKIIVRVIRIKVGSIHIYTSIPRHISYAVDKSSSSYFLVQKLLISRKPSIFLNGHGGILQSYSTFIFHNYPPVRHQNLSL
jgi:hypothetical protein